MTGLLSPTISSHARACAASLGHFLFGLYEYMLAPKKEKTQSQSKGYKKESIGDKDLPWPQRNTVLSDKSVGWA